MAINGLDAFQQILSTINENGDDDGDNNKTTLKRKKKEKKILIKSKFKPSPLAPLILNSTSINANGILIPTELDAATKEVNKIINKTDIGISENCGNTCTINNTIFVISKTLNKSLYKTKFHDYTLITNCDVTNNNKHLPLYLKPLLDVSWIYCIHVNHGSDLTITPERLRSHVTNGDIIAYKYYKCSIMGNDCVYYGFLPAIRKSLTNMFLPNMHYKCRIQLKPIWLREIYIYLEYMYECNCSENCSKWQCTLNDKSKIICCKHKIPWGHLYIMMGDQDIFCIETIPKEPRICQVCAQCSDCTKSTTFCRRHKVCNHKKNAIILDQHGVFISDTKIKNCTKYKI